MPSLADHAHVFAAFSSFSTQACVEKSFIQQELRQFRNSSSSDA